MTATTIADPLLTREEAAELLRVSIHTMACWHSSGRGPRQLKLGTGRSAAVRYRASDVHAFAADAAAIEADPADAWREARRKAIAERAAAKPKAAASKPKARRSKTRGG